VDQTESTSDAVVRKTPWWSISIGLHAAAALLIGFFWVVQAWEPAEPLIVRPPAAKVEPPKMDTSVPAPVPLKMEQQSPEALLTKELDDRNEDPDLAPIEGLKGQSEDFVTDQPFSFRSTNSSIGVGGGPAGKKGGPFGGRFLKRRGGPGGPNEKTEDAVLGALRWLARHQNPDGSWSVQGYVSRCRQACSPNPGHDDFDAGVTGLSLLAFLGAGYSHLSKDAHDGICFGDVVRKGLQWMMRNQDSEGCIGSRNAQKHVYNHLICALAITEAYGLTASTLFRDNAQKAVDFTVAAQNPGKGWRYVCRSGDNDSSVTGWAVMVLKSAELSGLVFPASAYDGTRRWFDEATEASYGRTGYTHAGTGKVFVPGLNEQFDHHEALSAISVMARIFMDRTKADPRTHHGADLLLRDKPVWGGNATDFYYWYYASLALFQYDGPKGSKWLSWNEPMKNALVGNQNLAASGCRAGSWEPVDRWSGEGGRVYATAINALTLEVYYRYANVLGVR
jgi:hypothetical protein